MASFRQTKLLIELDLITGINFQLQEYLYFDSDLYGALRTKTASDGLSDPQVFQNILQRFGPYIGPAIMHDGAFRMALEQQQADGTWQPFMVEDKDDSRANNLIDECLRADNCPWLMREIIYHMLGLFGWKAFDDDRKNAGNRPSGAEIAKAVQVPV